MQEEDDRGKEDLPPLPDPGDLGAGFAAAEGAAAAEDADDESGPALPPMPGIESPPGGNAAAIDPAAGAADPASVEVVVSDADADAADAGDPGVDEPVVAEPVDPFIGRTFGGYQLVEQIGRGGMGMVYRGVQVSLQRSVAVKLLNKALVDNEEFIKRFQREARAMATIHHQNIVSVIDFGETDGIWYMVAEFVEGTNLAKMIRDQLMVPPEELVPIVAHSLSGLAYVAKSQVIHRDIKPDNILIDRDGVAKIADFGLAKDMSKEETDLTAAGSAMGTPAYMSPEQCMGHALDGRSDVYSLGVTIYYALTGEKPFTGRSSFDIMTKQREYDPPRIHEINPRVPREISDLVAKMMQKAPAKRHADAGECREEWLQIGQDLGYLGSVTRSGEYLFPSDSTRQAEVSYPAAGAPVPPAAPDLSVVRGGAAPSPTDPGRGRTPSSAELDVPDAAIGAAEHAGSEEGTGPRRVGTEPRSHRRPTGGEGRVGASPVGASPVGESMVTCQRCGAHNRSTRRQCERCGASFVATPDPDAGTDQDEADRLFRIGRYKEAAAHYARLAESQGDRRQRSILRTKEREARSRMEERQFEDAQTAVDGLKRRGKYRDAEEVLRKVRSSASATSSIIARLDADLADLRRQRRGSRRRLLVLVALTLLAVAAALVWVLRDPIAEWLPVLRTILPGATDDAA